MPIFLAACRRLGFPQRDIVRLGDRRLSAWLMQVLAATERRCEAVSGQAVHRVTGVSQERGQGESSTQPGRSSGNCGGVAINMRVVLKPHW